MTLHPEQPESQLLSEFLNSGGEVLEFNERGQPRKWLCGKNERGEPTDPPGMDRKDVLHRINAAGRREGVDPDAADLDEIERWRSDWNNLV